MCAYICVCAHVHILNWYMASENLYTRDNLYIQTFPFVILSKFFMCYNFLISLEMSMLLSTTEVDWWRSREGPRFSDGHNCTLQGKIEDLGSSGEHGRSSFECSWKEAYGCLQWKARSVTSSTWILPGKLLSTLNMVNLFHYNVITSHPFVWFNFNFPDSSGTPGHESNI